jgi:hypothetical protein
LAAVGDDDLLGGLAALGAERFDLLADVHAFDDLTENDVFAVQPRGLGGADEELGAVGVGSGVGHGQDSGSGVLQLEVLVGELGSVDGLASGAVMVGEIASLAHEIGNDSVERAALVAESFFAGAQSAEVLGRFRNDVGSEFHGDPTDGSAVGGHVEVHAGQSHFSKVISEI